MQEPRLDQGEERSAIAWHHLVLSSLEDCNGCFVENNCAVLVAELSNAKQVVLEGGHDVGFAVWHLQLDVCFG
jgi:hypothetical protein